MSHESSHGLPSLLSLHLASIRCMPALGAEVAMVVGLGRIDGNSEKRTREKLKEGDTFFHTRKQADVNHWKHPGFMTNDQTSCQYHVFT